MSAVTAVLFGLTVIPLILFCPILGPDKGSWLTLERTEAHRSMSSRPGTPRRDRSLRRPIVPLVIGCVTIVLAIDVIVGVTAAPLIDVINRPTPSPLAPTTAQELARRPALRGDPWAADNLEAFETLDYRVEPIIMQTIRDSASHGLHVRNSVRRSFEPRTEGRLPEIWFFGGRGMFGPGVRDGHTIPSEVGRLAAADGIPVRVVNLANPAYVAFQEWLAFERRLARHAPPVVAVFLDGVADVEVQHEQPSTAPTHFNRDDVAAAIEGEHATPSRLESVLAWYARHGAVARAVRAAIAAEAEPNPQVVATNAVRVAGRARELASMVGDGRGTRTLFFWEPTPVGGPLIDSYRIASRLLPSSVIDLSTRLDTDAQVHFGWTDVNERGARLIAEAMYRHLRPLIDPPRTVSEHGNSR